jgi:hypothetical protein
MGVRCAAKRGRVASVASAFAVLIGCSVPRQATRPVAFDRFTPDDAVLFDDSFSPEVLGIGTGRPDGDPDLPGRVERADSVLLVRIATVTSDTDGTALGYHLVLQPVAPPLAGAPTPEPITIAVAPTSASYGFVKTADMALVGGRYVLFWRRFGEDGSVVVHWHAAADTPEMRRSVAQIRAAQRAPH